MKKVKKCQSRKVRNVDFDSLLNVFENELSTQTGDLATFVVKFLNKRVPPVEYLIILEAVTNLLFFSYSLIPIKFIIRSKKCLSLFENGSIPMTVKKRSRTK